MAIDARLKTVYTMVTDWCTARAIPYDIVCDEDNLQGILLFRKDRAHYRPLHNYIRSIIGDHHVHFETVPTRAGAVLLFSLGALTEHDITRIIKLLPETPTVTTSTYRDRIIAIFDPARTPHHRSNLYTLNHATPTVREQLLVSARLLADAQYRSPTSAHGRAGSNAQFRSSISQGHDDGSTPLETTDTPDTTTTGDTSQGTAQSTTVPNQSTNKPTTKPAAGLTKSEGTSDFTTTLDHVLNELEASPNPTGLGDNSMGGVGADHQPGDLFERFAQALKVLGARMHLGKPVQDLLKAQGINWKKSEDGQALIFFVQNAATNAPQPIARVGYQTLAKPQEFQVQLAAMLDFAQGKAPGATQQEYEAAQEANKQLRDIANSLAPQDPQKQQAVTQDQAMAPVTAGGDSWGDTAKPTSPGPQSPPAPASKKGPGPTPSAATPGAPKAVGPITAATPNKLMNAANKASKLK